jgi:hypothetical protein
MTKSQAKENQVKNKKWSSSTHVVNIKEVGIVNDSCWISSVVSCNNAAQKQKQKQEQQQQQTDHINQLTQQKAHQQQKPSTDSQASWGICKSS